MKHFIKEQLDDCLKALDPTTAAAGDEAYFLMVRAAFKDTVVKLVRALDATSPTAREAAGLPYEVGLLRQELYRFAEGLDKVKAK